MQILHRTIALSHLLRESILLLNNHSRFNGIGENELKVRTVSSERIKRLRLDWLEAYVAVVDHEGFTAAAEHLGYSQSNVSRHVDNLEKWLHKALFKSGASVELSPDGEDFVVTARQIIELLNASRAAIGENSKPVKKIDAKSIVI